MRHFIIIYTVLIKNVIILKNEIKNFFENNKIYSFNNLKIKK